MALLVLSLVMMLGTAALLLLMARSRRVEQKVNERLTALAFPGEPLTVAGAAEPGPMDSLARWLAQVGLPISPKAALSTFGLALLLAWLIGHLWGPLPALSWLAIAVTLGVLVPQVRYRQKVDQLVAQIPLFIDQIIRGLVAGRNVEGAFKLAAQSAEDPLRDLVERTQRNVDLGADMGEALREAASLHDIKELHMLALAVYTSRVYGGSPREMLESIVNLIRHREQSQRELRAMTSETRVTAWVLGVMPLAVVGFMMTSNPGFLDAMWSDESGRKVMFVAGAMQAIGGLILWRMVKRV